MKGALTIAIAAALIAGPAHAQSGDMTGNALQGRQLAVGECSQCHRVTRTALPPGRPRVGPDFGAIADMASVTPTSLFVFLHSSHPPMPNFVLSEQESANVIAYIMSLRRSHL